MTIVTPTRNNRVSYNEGSYSLSSSWMVLSNSTKELLSFHEGATVVV